MSFPTYPAYKDSGVEWLGEVPEHWNISPLKFSASCNDTVLPDSTDDDYEIEYVEISDVNEISGITGSTSYKFSDAPSRARRMLQDGDVLISTVRTYLRAIAPVVTPPENLIASTGFAVVRPRKGILDGAFLGYLLRAEWWISEVIARSVGVSYPAINASDLIRLNVPIPAWQEQTQIARFLDHETARIDALIEEQQRLIELLKEKRQAVISHAVTKGLDPTVPMKDSGVEWLGEVPAHWDVSRLKYHSSRIGDGLHSTPEYDDAGDYFFINGNNLVGGSICITATTRQVNFQEFLKHRVLLDSSTVLISINGTIGNLALYSGEPVILGKSAAYINCAKSLSPRFCLYLFSSGQIKRFFESQLTGTTIYNLSLRTIAETPTPLPSIDEQNCIVEFLNRKVEEFDELIDNAMRLSQLLTERRSALISAAVTGKIDVRNW